MVWRVVVIAALIVVVGFGNSYVVLRKNICFHPWVEVNDSVLVVVTREWGLFCWNHSRMAIQVM